ncbi:MAG: DUF2182 domain-containing protein [Pseudomonadota bacterium]
MRRLAFMTAPHWLVLYAGLLVAWVFVWSMSTDVSWGTLIRDICVTPVATAGWFGAFAMWVVMAAAMILPTALPSLATYDQLARLQFTGGGGLLVLGYGIVWVVFAAMAATAQMVSSQLGVDQAPWFAAALLAAAGAYQFSPLKAACLTRCRQPMTFFMQYWNIGPLKMGMLMGETCLGCCWALMALGLIGGMMSLGFMALATVLMVAEKLTRGPGLTRAIGIACFGASGFLLGGMI